MSQEIVDAVREIEREKGIESGTLVAALEDALLAAYKKTPGAARPEDAQPLYERVVEAFRDLGIHVETGAFGARMSVELVNDGPVTIVLE